MERAAVSSLWFETALLADGWATDVRVSIRDGLIGAIEVATPPAPDDEAHGAAAPGLCNVHSHAFQRAMAGLTEHRGPGVDDFWTWRELMYRFLGRLNPDDVEAIAAQAFVEMLQTGFTRVGEFHYLHNDAAGAPYADPAEMVARIAAAAADTGIGLTLLPVFYAHGGFGGAPPTPGQRRFITDIAGFGRLMEASGDALKALPDANLGLAPHSLRGVSPEELAQIEALCPRGPIHIHAAEQVKEVDDCLAWSGKRPVEWLLDNAGVDARWCLIHATHLSEAELPRLAASGAVAGLCPITEANLGDGVFPAQAFLARQGRFAIGTDSNVLIDPAQELRALEYAQRLTMRGRNVLASPARASTGGALYAGALAGGAQALGQSPVGLRVGALADIICLNRHHPSLAGRAGDALLDAWIFAGTPGIVTTVWRRGAKVVRHGRHCEAERIGARYRATLERLVAA
jgi:formiminoglutamate deiminase